MISRGLLPLNKFLSAVFVNAKKRFEDGLGRKVYVVLGNEAADLDSMVSAMLLALYLKVSKGEDALPLMNIPREDFALRKDAEWLFAKVGISSNSICFLDDVPLEQLCSEKRPSVFLVDHNKLSPSQTCLMPFVTGIVDHHEDESNASFGDIEKTIEMAGSCCTLVVRKVMNERPEILEDPGLAFMCLCCIIVDTANLDSSKKRFLPIDRKMVDYLQANLPEEWVWDLDQLHLKLLSLRSQIEGLRTDEILRKDLKVVKCGGTTVAVASLPSSLEECVAQCPDFFKEGESTCHIRSWDVLVVMTVFSGASGTLRQLAVISNQFRQLDQLTRGLESSAELDLERLLVFGIPHVYAQRNILASRKKLIPLLNKIL